jgi:hypothetical protein
LYLVSSRYADVPAYDGTAAAGTIDAVSSQPKAPGVFVVWRLPLQCSIQPRKWLSVALRTPK